MFNGFKKQGVKVRISPGLGNNLGYRVTTFIVLATILFRGYIRPELDRFRRVQKRRLPVYYGLNLVGAAPRDVGTALHVIGHVLVVKRFTRPAGRGAHPYHVQDCVEKFSGIARQNHGFLITTTSALSGPVISMATWTLLKFQRSLKFPLSRRNIKGVDNTRRNPERDSLLHGDPSSTDKSIKSWILWLASIGPVNFSDVTALICARNCLSALCEFGVNLAHFRSVRDRGGGKL